MMSAQGRDPFDLQRFVAAQEPVYAQVYRELAAGQKQSHWIWFIFPQLKSLGRSATALRFGIASRAEAAAYLAHPVLGPRLVACVELMLAVPDRTLSEIMPYPDDLKFISSMTLFEALAAKPQIFARALERFAVGVRDRATLELLAVDC